MRGLAETPVGISGLLERGQWEIHVAVVLSDASLYVDRVPRP